VLPPDDSDDAPDLGPADGRQLRWEEHNRVRRQRLLDAAIHLLDEREVGADLRMAEIAERAGLRRPVIYRYFTDRQALDAAIEAEVAARLAHEIVPRLDVRQPIIDIIHDSIAVYVRWSEEHPSLRWIIDRGARSPGGPVEQGFSDIAAIIATLVLAAIDGLDMPVTERERRYVDPLVHGLVEAVVGTVRRWVSLEDRPPAKVLVHLATESVWYIMAGHAHNLGVTLERDQNLADLPSANRG
jgi:AcrR family transcriptional regulator